ncbi:hypothetical protein [Magnetospirillum moscoviense]|uniref:hypothetical protein n=1 Tax=Magnetospirillum moscoviense TaxID=1437059 RepID=UPI000A450405|nr:hypothetical protein [Magnetospirillum moscoviense]
MPSDDKQIYPKSLRTDSVKAIIALLAKQAALDALRASNDNRPSGNNPPNGSNGGEA